MKWQPIDPETAPKLVADAIGAGSMEPEAIIEKLERVESMERVDAKLAIMRAIYAGAIEEHPDVDGCYRVVAPDPD